MTTRIAVRACTRMTQYVWRNLTIFCQVKQIDGVTKWLASAGLVGTNVAGHVGTCCGVGFFYIYNNNYALVYSFLLVGLRTPVHSRTGARTHARTYARTHTVSINICDFTGYEHATRTHLTLSLRTPCTVPTYPVTGEVGTVRLRVVDIVFCRNE